MEEASITLAQNLLKKYRSKQAWFRPNTTQLNLCYIQYTFLLLKWNITLKSYNIYHSNYLHFFKSYFYLAELMVCYSLIFIYVRIYGRSYYCTIFHAQSVFTSAVFEEGVLFFPTTFREPRVPRLEIISIFCF